MVFTLLVRSFSRPNTLCALLLFALWACKSPEGSPSGATPTRSSLTALPLPPASSSAPTPPAAPAAVSAPPISSGPRLQALGVTVTRTYRPRTTEWRLVEGLNWQGAAEPLPPLPPAEATPSPPCPAGMQLIKGGFLLDKARREDTDEVQFLQNQACTFWRTADRDVNGLCDRFNQEKWKALAADLPRKPMNFCMDRHEYPNARGEFPLVVVTFSEAEKYCSREGKRLCTESEWTFACEGEEGLPYPYGYERDTNVCNIGVLGPGPDKDTFRPRFTEHTARGIDLSWRGKRSGESPRCVSPFGVEDMTGNVDEWTRTVRRYGYKMIMKGGHWGPGRHRCRPQTRGHGPFYIRYDQGFRCCQDAP